MSDGCELRSTCAGCREYGHCEKTNTPETHEFIEGMRKMAESEGYRYRPQRGKTTRKRAASMKVKR